MSKPTTYAVLYAYDDGRTVVRYLSPRTDTRLAREVLGLQRRARAVGQRSPYFLSTLREHVL